MKKTIYILLFTLLCSLSVQSQGIYNNNDKSEQQSGSGIWEQSSSQTEEYSPSILRAKPEPPVGPGENEVPVEGGLLVLVALAGARLIKRMKN